MVGTEEGCILSCNRAKGQGDRTSAIFDGDEHPSPLHVKPCKAAQWMIAMAADHNSSGRLATGAYDTSGMM